MVIDNLDLRWTDSTFRPFETNPPLIVDSDAVLALSISLQRFKTIARQDGEISELNGGFQAVQLQARRALATGERLDTFAGREIRRSLVPIADDQKLE